MTEPERKEIIDVPVKTLITPANELGAFNVEAIEKQVKDFKRVMGLAIGMTNSRDWSDFGGTPFLESSGAEKIARPFGISYRPMSEIQCEEREDKKGKYMIFTSHYRIEWGQVYVEWEGRASTRGEFFSHHQKRDFEDIPIPHVMAQAQTNAIGNGIKRLLGLRNLTWEQLAPYGIKPGKKVDFTKKAEAAAQSGGSKTSEKKADEDKKPWWTSEYKDKQYIFAKVGQHFDEAFLTSLGMKPGKTAGQFFTSNDVAGVQRELEKMMEFHKEEKKEAKQTAEDLPEIS